MMDAPRHRAVLRALLTPVLAVLLAFPLLVPAGGKAAAAVGVDTAAMDLVSDGVFASAETDRVAPGLDVTRFSRLEEAGWTAGSVLRADLSEETLEVDVVNSGAVTRTATVSEHVERAGAVAGVNGDFFDINYSNAAQGTAIGAGGLLNASDAAHPALTVSGGRAAISAISAEATFTAAGAQHEAHGVNTPRLPAGGIGVYTPGWGEYTLDRPVGGPDEIAADAVRVTVSGGAVTEVVEVTGDGAPADIPEDGFVLLGREAGGVLLAELEPGAAVDVDLAASVPADVALTGNEVLVADGAIVAQDEAVHPRTAVGVGPDGTELFVLALDGRAHFGRGMSLPELAQLLIDMGAEHAVNLDGGGSTAMVARSAGQDRATLRNTPSDGGERPVPNALVFRTTAEQGELQDLQVAPVSGHEHAGRVFPGLHRTVRATGLDGSYAPVPAPGEFSIQDEGLDLASADGERAVVRGVHRTEAGVEYAAGDLRASTLIEVLGRLDHVRASRNTLALDSAGDSELVRLSGYDADGREAPIEVADAEVTAPEGFTVEAEGLDALRITAESDESAGTVNLDIAGHRVQIAVTAGFEEREVIDFAGGTENWTFGSDRATGGIEPAEGPEPGTPGLRLHYDFTEQSGTRGGYAIATEPVELPGQPREVSMWMHGAGNGEWPRLQVRSGEGVVSNLDGPTVTWEGWQKISFPVPAGTAYPLTLERIRMMETRPDARYQGEVVIGPVSVVVSSDVDAPAQAPVHDPFVVTDGTVADRPLRIAVMSDAQFVARAPESDIVQAARETFREMVAQDPDLLIINGDLVDEASPEDFALARQVIDEEIGDAVPWIYVPGNHEIMGGPIENFEQEFGPTHQVRTVDRTRVITLDTSTGSLRGGGMDQLRMLEEELRQAAEDASVTGAVVFAHHPTRDPKPDQASQFSDREEAAAFERLLAEVRAETGLSTAFIAGHAGVFHASSAEGVSYAIAGNSGKSPSWTPERGGFTGWMMLGINPAAGDVGRLPDAPQSRLAWMRAEVNPRVEELRLDGPAELGVGEQADVLATLVQDGTREVPVAWPVSAQWGGEGIAVDDGGAGQALTALALENADDSPLRYNPATGTLTAVAPGEGVLTVTVNGRTAELPVTVAAEEPSEPEPIEPAPTEPAPTEPAPTEPGPGEPGAPEPTEPDAPAPGGPDDPGGAGGQPGGEPDRRPDNDPAAGPGGALPRTGSEVGAWLAGAVALLLAGAAALGAARHRGRE